METATEKVISKARMITLPLLSLFGVEVTYSLIEEAHLLGLGIPEKHWLQMFRKPAVNSALGTNGTSKAILQSPEQEEKGA